MESIEDYREYIINILMKAKVLYMRHDIDVRIRAANKIVDFDRGIFNLALEQLVDDGLVVTVRIGDIHAVQYMHADRWVQVNELG